MSDSILRGNPQTGMYRLIRLLAVSVAVNSAAVTAYMSARRVKRSVKGSM